MSDSQEFFPRFHGEISKDAQVRGVHNKEIKGNRKKKRRGAERTYKGRQYQRHAR